MKEEQTNPPLQSALDQMSKSDLINLVAEIEQINSTNPKDSREQINQVMLDRIPNYVFI